MGAGLRTFQRYVADGKIPKAAMYRLPGKLFFIEAELDRMLKGGGIK